MPYITVIFVAYFLGLYFSLAVAEIFATLVGLVGMVFWIRDFRMHKAVPFPGQLKFSFIILFLTFLVGYLINERRAAPEDYISAFSWPLLVLFTGYLISLDFKKIINIFYQTSYIAIPLVAVICIYQFFTGTNPFNSTQTINKIGDYYRAVGMAGPLTTSYSFAMLFVFFLTRLLTYKFNIKEKVFQSLTIFSSLVIPFATLSRGPVLAMILACFLALFFESHWLSLVIAIAVALVPTILVLVNNTFAYKFHALVFMQDSSVAYRQKVMLANLAMFKDHLFFGIGSCNSPYYLREYYDKLGWIDFKFMNAASNNYIGFLSETGILGFSLFMFICIYLMKICYDIYRKQTDREIKSIALALLGAQICFHLSGLMEGVFFSSFPRHFIILIWSMVLGLYLSERRAKNI